MNRPLEAADLAKAQRWAITLGASAFILAALSAVWDLQQFYQSYLLAFIFWLGLALGCLALWMLHHLVGGAWGEAIHQLLRCGARTLPLAALLFVPLLFGMRDIYPWAVADVAAQDPIVQQKHTYLNAPFFIGRAAFFFVIWLLWAALLYRGWRKLRRSPSASLERRQQLLSGYGLILYVLTATFAAVDWLMSLEPHWHSSLYGFAFIVGQVLTALAGLTVLLFLQGGPGRAALQTAKPLLDLGNLLMAFVLLWAYAAFMQFLIIWSANLQHEVPWYLRRSGGGWTVIIGLLIVAHFLIPFVVLLIRRSKQRLAILATVAGGVLVMRLMDLHWLIAPAFKPDGWSVHWLDPLLLVGLGGIWGGAFLQHWKQSLSLPANLEETAL